MVKEYLADTTSEFLQLVDIGVTGPAKNTAHALPAPFIAAARFNTCYGAPIESSMVAYGLRDNADRRIPGTSSYTALEIDPGYLSPGVCLFCFERPGASDLVRAVVR